MVDPGRRFGAARGRTRPFAGGGALLAAFAACLATAALADPANLEAGLPAEVSDARTLDRGERQWQVGARFDREHGGARGLLVEPQLQAGFTDRLQGSIGVRGLSGSADRTGSGDLRAQLFGRVVDERGAMPAFAGFVQADLPTGTGSRGVDTALRLIATKTLGAHAGIRQVHANLAWVRNASPAPEERANRARGILGWSMSLDDRTAVVADVLREQARERGAMASIAELGVRREVWPGAIVSVGAGVGHGGGSAAPRWRLVAGFEQGFRHTGTAGGAHR